MDTRAFLLAAVTALGLPAASHAEDIGKPLTAEILPGWQQADGTRVAAIRLSLQPGWKTYWRSWPTPEVFHSNGMRSIGYSNEVVLPLAIAPRRTDKPVKLNVTLDLGVCRDICMPQTVTVKGTLDSTATQPTPAIAAALAAQPYSASEAGVRRATCALKPTADGFEITAKLTMPSTGGREVVVIEPGSDKIWSSETDTKRRGNTLTARGDLVPMSGGTVALDRSAIRITVLGKNRAVDIQGCSQG